MVELVKWVKSGGDGLGLSSGFWFGFAFANPAFDSEFAIHCIGFGKAVINFGSKGMERHPAPMILLDTGQFCAPPTAGAADFDSLGAEIFGGLQCFFHRPPERDAAFQLQGHILSD